MEELISVIVPVYGAESYLEKCVRVIMEQTYQNLEIILVDDGSTDKTGKLLVSDGASSVINMRGNAEFEIAGGTLESVSYNVIDMSFAGNLTSTKLVVSGGKLITNGNVVIGAFGGTLLLNAPEVAGFIHIAVGIIVVPLQTIQGQVEIGHREGLVHQDLLGVGSHVEVLFTLGDTELHRCSNT